MRTTMMAALAAVAMALTACSPGASSHGGGTSPYSAPHGFGGAPGEQATSAAAAVPDPCALVTDQEVAMLTHTTVIRHETRNLAAMSGCIWTLHSSESQAIADPTVQLATEPNKDLGAGIDSYQDQTRGYTPISGLADKASRGRGNSGADQTVVLKHGIVVVVTVQIYGNSNDDAASDSLARFATAGL